MFEPAAERAAEGRMSGTAKVAATDVGSVRARALAAAAHVLATRGVDALSLRAIAAEAGVAAASIYHYFANKDELLLSLAVQGFAELRDDILRLQADPEINSPMRGGHRAFFTFVGARPALFSLMFSDRMLSRHAALREAEHQAFLAYEAAVRAEGRIPQKHQENATVAIWALGRGMAAIISSQPDGALPEDYATKLFEGAAYLIDRPAE
jgi:AcrR family transcriptional regulator